MVTSFDTLKTAFIETLDYIKNNGSILQPSDEIQINIMKKATINCTTLTQLGSLGYMPVVNRNLGLDNIVTSPNPLMTTSLQFGRANTEWYFMYGNCDDFAWTFTIMAVPMCTPHIAKKYNINGQEGYLYYLFGGYGGLNGDWEKIPYMMMQADYVTDTQTNFKWDAILDINSSVIKKASLHSTGPGQFEIDVRWITSKGLYTGIKSSLNAVTTPFYNSNSTCFPICLANVGGVYWSYTNMTVNSSAGSFTGDGIGWFDHQWMSGGYIDNTVVAAIQNIKNYISNPPLTVRWIWLSLQDTNDNVQYMIWYFVTETIKNGDEFTTDSFNKYTFDSNPDYASNKTCKIKVLDTISITSETGVSSVYPIKYLIILPDKQYIMKATFGKSTVSLPGGLNWEGPGMLYNTTYDGLEDTLTGKCFFEAQGFYSNEDFLKNLSLNTGIQDESMVEFTFKKKSKLVILSILYLFFIFYLFLVLFLTIIYFLIFFRRR